MGTIIRVTKGVTKSPSVDINTVPFQNNETERSNFNKSDISSTSHSQLQCMF